MEMLVLKAGNGKYLTYNRDKQKDRFSDYKYGLLPFNEMFGEGISIVCVNKSLDDMYEPKDWKKFQKKIKCFYSVRDKWNEWVKNCLPSKFIEEISVQIVQVRTSWDEIPLGEFPLDEPDSVAPFPTKISKDFIKKMCEVSFKKDFSLCTEDEVKSILIDDARFLNQSELDNVANRVREIHEKRQYKKRTPKKRKPKVIKIKKPKEVKDED